MNAELGALRARLGAAFPDMTDEAIDDRIALCVLGTDAMRGTLGCSLHSIFVGGFAQVPHANLHRIPPRTGVPYIDREAVRPTRIGDNQFAPHTIFQGQLQAFDHGTDQERLRFWGFGDHTCLGRRMSLHIWQAISAQICQAAPRVQVDTFTMRKDDVFAIPDLFRITVHDN